MPKTARRVKKAMRESLNLKDEQIEQLKRLFPEVVADGKVNWEKLKAVLGEAVDTSFEKFSFTWSGKGEAIRNVLVPSKATLRPDKKESIRFDEARHVFIEGDNLEVLKLLQNAYFEKVRMIYIDPPYNTGNDFVYKDDFKNSIKNYLDQSGQTDDEGNRLQTNTDASGRFHSDWLNMMYPRLKLAWNLLSNEGVIFISINDNEIHRLQLLLDEVFGEENFVASFVWKSRQNKDNRNITGVSIDHEYIVCYSKENQFRVLRGAERKKEQYANPDNDPRGPWVSGNMVGILPENLRPNCHYDLINPETKINYGKPNLGWRYDKVTMSRLIEEKRVLWPNSQNGRPRRKVFLKELSNKFTNFSSVMGENLYTRHGTAEMQDIFGFRAFDFPKPSLLIRELVDQVADAEEENIILDFFAGSGVTAHAVLAQNRDDGGNRRFLLVQLPEPIEPNSECCEEGYKTIADIAKERIRRVVKGYGEEPQPIDDGFKVFKLSASNYPENNFEYDPEKSGQENEKAYKSYLEKASQFDLFAKTSEEDLVYENVIKEGLDLNAKISEISLGKNKVFQAKDERSEILVCLDTKIADATVKTLSTDDHKGKIFICYDKAVDDSSKANLGLHLSLRTI